MAMAMTFGVVAGGCCGPSGGQGDKGGGPVDGATAGQEPETTGAAPVGLASCQLQAGPHVLAGTEAAAATPAATWTGSRFGVAWLTGGDVLFAQADASGKLLGGTSVVATDAKDAPMREVLRELDIMWTGDEYLVAGNLRRDEGRKVCAAVLAMGTDGARAGNPVCVLNGTTIQFDRQVAFAWTGERVLALAATGSLADRLMAGSFDLPPFRRHGPEEVLAPAAASTAHDSMDFPLAIAWTGTVGRWVAARVRDDGETRYFTGSIDLEARPVGEAAKIEMKPRMESDLPVGLSADRLPVAVTASSIFVARLGPGKLVSVPGFGTDGRQSGALGDLQKKTSAWLMALRGAQEHVWAVWLENRREKRGASYLFDMWAARLGVDGGMVGDPVLVTEVRVGEALHVDVAGTPDGAAIVWTPHGAGAGVHMAVIGCH